MVLYRTVDWGAAMAGDEIKLTEWDMEIPKDNKFEKWPVEKVGHTAPAETAEQRLAEATKLGEILALKMKEYSTMKLAEGKPAKQSEVAAYLALTIAAHWEVHALRLEREHQVMREALTEISEGKGRYSLDQYEHACNTIEDMKELALSALSQIGKP